MKRLPELFCVVLALLFIVACSSAPKVETAPIEKPAEKAIVPEQQVILQEPLPSEDTLRKGEPVVLDSITASVNDTVENAPVELLPLPPQTDTVATQAPRVDPFEEIEKVVLANFATADSMLGLNDPVSAVTVVERFTVLNPLWESWMKRATETLERAKNAMKSEARYGFSVGVYTGVAARSSDPYVEIQKIVAASFAYADSVIASGMPELAIPEMERLLVLNTVLNGWILQASTIMERAREMREATLDRFRAIASMIVNENATSGDYTTVRALADSLVSLEPGDSLKTFAQKQVGVAYTKTLNKALAEKARILSNAEKSGDFSTADSLANYLVLRYRDFADTLKLEQWQESIHAQAVLNSMDKDYWKTHKTADVFAEAEKLASAGKFSEAKELYLKLTTSSERERALKSLANFGHDVCVSARKKASNLFATALSSKKPADKRKNLERAVESLAPCLENFADDPEAKKALEDKKILEQELKN